MEVQSQNIFAVGVDLGGTKIGIGLVDISGKTHHYIKLPTDVAGGPLAIQKQIISAVEEIKKMVQDPIVGVGIGVPGQIQKETGIVYFAPNLNWHNVPFKEGLQDLHLPIFITNDVRAATWGEWQYGAGKGCDDLICMFVGTGIGGGIVVNGVFLEGSSNTAGEIGHMTIDVHGPLCTCGNKGCLEAFAGGWAIAKTSREALIVHPTEGKYLLELVNGKIESVTGKMVIEAAYAKDAFAQHLIDKVIQSIIIGCAGLANAFNPSRIILGGGVMEGLMSYIPLIDQGVKKHALAAATKSLQIVPSALHAEAGIIGGAALAFHSYQLQEVVCKN